MVTQSNHTYLDMVKMRKAAGRLWAVTIPLCMISGFFFMYIAFLEAAITEHKSEPFVSWPLPHYVNDHFLDTMAAGTMALGVITFIVLLFALNSLKLCPSLADLEKHRIS